ncbi:hypothetical protein Tco_0980258 [Tanacetum coccineum]
MLDQYHKELHEQFSQILSTIRKNKTPEPEAPTFAITTRSGISTQDPPFPTPPTSANHTEGATKKEGPEDTEPSIIQEPAPLPSIFYQPSKKNSKKRPPQSSLVRSVLLLSKGVYPKKKEIAEASHWEEEDSNEALAVSFYPRTESVELLEWRASENLLKPSSVEPPTLELKELPEHLEYAFLQEYNQLPVVISSALSIVEKARILEVLQNHKGVIAWSITDIKGIDSSFCTHKILMEDEFKPVSNLKDE